MALWRHNPMLVVMLASLVTTLLVLGWLELRMALRLRRAGKEWAWIYIRFPGVGGH